MDSHTIDHALRRLCKNFVYGQPVEIVLVGGAAGMITGLLGKDRTTVDCDIISYKPERALGAVELAAEAIGQEMGLPTDWFNSNVQIRADTLPSDWAARGILIDRGDWLTIYAIGRADLIAMKFLAHRVRDIEDLVALRVTSDDRTFTRAFLSGLRASGSDRQEIEEAERVVESWPVISE